MLGFLRDYLVSVGITSRSSARQEKNSFPGRISRRQEGPTDTTPDEQGVLAAENTPLPLFLYLATNEPTMTRCVHEQNRGVFSGALNIIVNKALLE